MRDLERPLGTVEEHLGNESRDIMEVLLSAHATHFLDGLMGGTGIMIEGPSGCGKTTLLRTFYDLDGQVYRSDKVTPASFVSHDASRTEEELAEDDLLPELRHKTLVCGDMATWFDGPEERIREIWGMFARVFDGDGLVTNSGTHGRRGYTDDLRFNFLGATTPIPARGHRVMGSVGNRLLFIWMGDDDKTEREALEELIVGTDYKTKVNECRRAVHFYLGDLWDHYGGHAGVDWERDPSDDVLDVLEYLTKLMRYARAPMIEGGPDREGKARPGPMLYDLASGHALLEGRETVHMDDLGVAARCALSSMPSERRPLVRALVDPEIDDTLDTDDVADICDVTPPTARTRMKLLDDLGLAFHMPPNGEQDPHTVMLRPGFDWPEGFDYPY